MGAILCLLSRLDIDEAPRSAPEGAVFDEEACDGPLRNNDLIFIIFIGWLLSQINTNTKTKKNDHKCSWNWQIG